MSKLKLVYIEWCDAVANPNWFERDQAMKWAQTTEWVIKEVGWILEETDEYLSLASCWKPEDPNTEEQFKLLQKIPKTWIIKRKVLTV